MFLFLGVAFRIVCPAVIMDGIMLLWSLHTCTEQERIWPTQQDCFVDSM
jgi:hypothetical protein